MSSDEERKLLPSDADDVEEYPCASVEGLRKNQTYGGGTAKQRFFILSAVIVLQGLLNIVLFVALFVRRDTSMDAQQHDNNILYSPARDAIRPVQKVFVPDFKSSTTYIRDPSPEVDQAWKDLYDDFLVARISKDEAAFLPNKTVPIPGDKDHYAVGLAVFHHLHCLDYIRMALNPEYYYGDPLTGTVSMSKDDKDHANHCVDTLRQVVMCFSDISDSLVVWKWHPERGRALAHMNVPHQCRDFDSILEWEKQHLPLKDGFDTSAHVDES